jgi:hypothetical protein
MNPGSDIAGKSMTEPRRGRLTAIAVAALLVLALDFITPQAAPMYDSVHYLAVASSGLSAGAPLAAPYVYRFAAPMAVWMLHAVSGLPALTLFHLLALGAAWATLVLAYALSRAVGAPHAQGVLIMAVLAASLFQVRFPLSEPAMVDIEAYPLIILAFLLLLRESYAWALCVSLLGMLFKEFLVIPCVLLVVVRGRDYLRQPSSRPLLWMLAAIIAAGAAVLLPRMLIPVHAAFGPNFRLELPGTDRTAYLTNLRSMLSNPLAPGQAVNLLLSLVSYLLPALMLATPGRIRNLCRRMGDSRLPVLVHTLLVVVLALLGGTNIMVFVTYLAPVLVVTLALLLRENPSRLELAVMAASVVLFNRVLAPLGTAGGDPLEGVAFYGGWWTVLDATTVHRFAEASGYVLLAALVRWGVQGKNLGLRLGRLGRPMQP